MTARPLKPSWCGLCWTTHNLADRCDPVERAAVVDARNASMRLALAELIGHAKTAKPQPYRHSFSYAAETAWNDPWWT